MTKQKIIYTYLMGDMLHYGHLRVLQQAKQMAEYHICGVLSDRIANKWQVPMICSYDERKAVIEELECVDEVVCQDSIDPTGNLKAIHADYPEAKLVLLQGYQKWGQMPGVEYIRQIGGETIKPEYYNRLSRDNIVKKFLNAVISEDSKPFQPLRDIKFGNLSYYNEKVSTKANTLNSLKTMLQKSIIEELFIFTASQWEQFASRIIKSVKKRFVGEIVVRSSSPV